jgi:hypothetical protein
LVIGGLPFCSTEDVVVVVVVVVDNACWFRGDHEGLKHGRIKGMVLLLATGYRYSYLHGEKIVFYYRVLSR